MNLFFVVVLLVLIGVSLIADYKWKQWIKSRNEVREMERQLSSITAQSGQFEPEVTAK